MSRYRFDQLRGFAGTLLQRVGLAEERAATVADVLLEGDLLGHDTHGLALLAAYLGELERGAMRRDGDLEIVSDRPAVALWDGHRLPGPWLMVRAVDAALVRARSLGSATIVIRRSHHIACLAAYLLRATQQKMALLIASSDPNSASVAPFGGTRAVFTPNPLAAGFPTAGDPVLIDVSASITTNGMVARRHQAKAAFAYPSLLDASGRPTADPAVMYASPPGTILPLGGLDAGHKGYGLALMIEALTGGLAGFGRADAKEGWGATVFVQALDPDAFGGLDAFVRQKEHIAQQCRDNPPIDPTAPVRLPGERGLARRRRQLAEGVELHPTIMPALLPWAARLSVAPPDAL